VAGFGIASLSAKQSEAAPRRQGGASLFRQRDIVRAVTALARAGKSVASVDLKPDGTISLVTNGARGMDVAADASIVATGRIAALGQE
jgi:hypothetical protein